MPEEAALPPGNERLAQRAKGLWRADDARLGSSLFSSVKALRETSDLFREDAADPAVLGTGESQVCQAPEPSHRLNSSVEELTTQK